MIQDLPGHSPIGLIDEPRDGEFAGSINGYKKIKLALLGPDLGDVNLEVPNWVSFKLLPLGFVTFDIRQTGYPMTLKTAMQKRTL